MPTKRPDPTGGCGALRVSQSGAARQGRILPATAANPKTASPLGGFAVEFEERPPPKTPPSGTGGARCAAASRSAWTCRSPAQSSSADARMGGQPKQLIYQSTMAFTVSAAINGAQQSSLGPAMRADRVAKAQKLVQMASRLHDVVDSSIRKHTSEAASGEDLATDVVDAALLAKADELAYTRKELEEKIQILLLPPVPPPPPPPPPLPMPPSPMKEPATAAASASPTRALTLPTPRNSSPPPDLSAFFARARPPSRASRRR